MLSQNEAEHQYHSIILSLSYQFPIFIAVKATEIMKKKTLADFFFLQIFFHQSLAIDQTKQIE